MASMNSKFGNNKFDQSLFDQKHAWVTVVNPMNHRSLLQACDNCGVVKSENSVVKRCKASRHKGLISNAMMASQRVAV